MRILAGLAVDRAWQGRDLGRSLLCDAVLRILQAAAIGGIRAGLVPAISEDAKRFSQRYGVGDSPVNPMTVMMTVADAEKALSGKEPAGVCPAATGDAYLAFRIARPVCVPQAGTRGSPCVYSLPRPGTPPVNSRP